MANSPLLQIPQVAPSQTNKETTINDGISILERSLNDIKSIDLTSDDVELNLTDYTRAFLMNCSGHTEERDLTIPASKRLFAVQNSGSSNVTVKITGDVGDPAVIPPGSFVVLFNTGSTIYKISDSAASGEVTSFLDLPDTPNAYTEHGGHALVVKIDETGLEFGTIAVSFVQLTDSPSSYSGQGGKLVRVNSGGTGLEFTTHLDTFLKLTDTPSDYISRAGQMIVVKADETGVEFQDVPEPIIQATRNFVLENAGFEEGNFTNWTLTSTSTASWLVDTGYAGIGPSEGSYLAYFPTDEGTEPASLSYDINLLDQAYEVELDGEADIVVTIGMASPFGDTGYIEVEFFDSDELSLGSEESPQYTGTMEIIDRTFRTSIPTGARTATITLHALHAGESESGDPDNMSFVFDDLRVQLKLEVDHINTFIQLFDTPLAYTGHAGKKLVVNATEDGVEFATDSNVTSFLNLTDTPNNYTGAGLKFLRVNTDANAIEFVTASVLHMSGFPSAFTGHSGKVLRVNVGESAVEFVTNNLNTLADVNTSGAVEGDVLIYDADTATWLPGPMSGSAEYPDMEGNAGKVLAVNSEEDGVEWVEQTGSGGGIDLTSFGVSISTNGTPDALGLLFRFVSPGTFTLPEDLTGSYGYAGDAPTGNVDFDIQKNGSSIGTMSFATSSNTATFTFASDVSFTAGDRLEIFAPSDLQSIGDVSATFIGAVVGESS